METLQCIIERITFHNDENGFSVIKCRVKGKREIITAVGSIPKVYTGSVLKLYGSWKMHSKYGMQFAFQHCEETLPATVEGIKKYLGSGLIKGIGPVFAERITEHFGTKTLEIIDDDPDRLSEVQGIGDVRIEKIKKSWTEQKEIRNIMLFLSAHDVSTSLAAKIYKQYGDQSIDAVKENPYRLADDIWGVGFRIADSIAERLGFEHECFERIRSGILYTMNKFSEAGHCFAFKEELINAAVETLEVEPNIIYAPLETMIQNKDLMTEDEAVYLPMFYYSEVGTANRLLILMSKKRISRRNLFEIDEYADTDFKRIHYDETQLEAIRKASENKVLVLTGGPGTGKTTTTLGIIRAYRETGAKILLAAPTGRAAKRMSEVTHMEAKTIHRLLEMRPPDGFQRNEDNPLRGDILIVDECSMIDILLMNSLLKAIPDNMTLILVGDVDQLPSIGAGKVLSDILASGVVPSIRLEKIFRQAQKSRIITNAHKINHGDMPYLPDSNSDFVFTEEEDNEAAAEHIVKLCSETLPKKGISIENIQVLTPMRRGAIGAANLNQLLQNALNKEKICLKHAGIEFRLKDKVMQIRNNYGKSVFNGDIGFISSVNQYDDELTVNFDGREVVYDISELDEIVLAYAATIHKSQGSEFQYVVMPLMMTHYIMLQRNLLYTGVTRAKKGLFLVGEKKAVYIAVKNNKIIERNTRLAERLSEFREEI